MSSSAQQRPALQKQLNTQMDVCWFGLPMPGRPCAFVDKALEEQYQAAAHTHAAHLTIFILTANGLNLIMHGSMASGSSVKTVDDTQQRMQLVGITIAVLVVSTRAWLFSQKEPRKSHLAFANLTAAAHVMTVVAEVALGAVPYSAESVQAYVPFAMRASMYTCCVHLNAAPPMHHALHAFTWTLQILRDGKTIDDLWSFRDRPMDSQHAFITLVQSLALEIAGGLVQKMLREMFVAQQVMSSNVTRGAEESSTALPAQAPIGDRAEMETGIFLQAASMAPVSLHQKVAAAAPSPLYQQGGTPLDQAMALRPSASEGVDPLLPLRLKFVDDQLELEYSASLFRDSCKQTLGCLTFGSCAWFPLIFIGSVPNLFVVGCAMIHLLPSLAGRLIVSRHPNQQKACIYFGRVIIGTFALSTGTWLGLQRYWPLAQVPGNVSSYLALVWFFQTFLIRLFHLPREHRLCYTLLTIIFHGISPRWSVLSRAEQVNLMWSAIITGELFGHAYELVVRRYYYAHRRKAQLNLAADGTVLTEAEQVAPKLPSKISFDANVKPGQTKAKRDVSQLNFLISETASNLAISAPIASPSPVTGGDCRAIAQRVPALASLEVSKPSMVGLDATRGSGKTAAQLPSPVAPLSVAYAAGPFGRGSPPSHDQTNGPFSGSRLATDGPFGRKPSAEVSAAVMDELPVDWANESTSSAALAGRPETPAFAPPPRPSLTLTTPKRNSRILEPMPMAQSALPVHRLLMWCRDPHLERWVVAKMHHENFGLQVGMMVVQIFCIAAIATEDINLALTLPPTVVALLLRCWLHGHVDLMRAQRLNLLWTSVMDFFFTTIIFVSVIYYPVAEMEKFAALAHEPEPRLFARPKNDYVAGTQPWVPFLCVINAFMVLANRAMNLPLSRPSHMALRVALVLMRGMGEWRITGMLMKQPIMAVASQIGGLVFGHLFELQQRTNVLTLMKLSQDLVAGGFPATEQEKSLISRAFYSTELSHRLLQKRIDVVDLQLRNVLGSGQFGVVNRGIWFGPSGLEPLSVAVKTFHRTRLSERTLQSFIRSAEIELSLVPHANVLRLLGVAWSIESARVCSIFELCTGGTLAEVLGPLSRSWPQTQKWRVSSGIASGLAFLHTQAPPVMHRDLKPDNILFDDRNAFTPKISDFGTSRNVIDASGMATDGGGKETMTTDCSTPLFSAPEMLLRQHYNLSVDVWALGCCLCCLYNNTISPYEGHQSSASSSATKLAVAASPQHGESASSTGSPSSSSPLELHHKQSSSAVDRGGKRIKSLFVNIMEGTQRPSIAAVTGEAMPSSVYTAVEQIIADCCQRDPRARPTAIEVNERLDMSRMPMDK